ncbi:MAG TPA: PhoPQ-activated pathogenicity-related family protein [Blastocatellia bacterium]|nr:PhoPQ-activated pathogenicity-related family protein [Blastocatellia bacterium]
MNRKTQLSLIRPFMLFALTLLVAGGVSAGPRERDVRKQTALDRYVFKPDSNFSYNLVNTIRSAGYTAFVLELTSQQWRTADEVDRPLWKHWLTIVQPDQVNTSTGFLLINGGRNGGRMPTTADAIITSMAVGTHAVVADLRMVPNEPLILKEEGKSRTEDAIIAYSWEKFLKTGDETWPLRLPMTKAAVRALDTITAFCGSAERGSVKVDKFVVAGGSKRGWTTWTTAAVDDRVVAIIPIVIDCLNTQKSLDHHFRSYGFWAPAISDYSNLHSWSGTPEYAALMKIEDPYFYRERLTMPKLIMNSTGDQYFLPDSSQFYYDDLRGEKYLRYVPNTQHDLRNSDAINSVHAFFESVVSGSARPRFTWKFEKDGSITVQTKDQPTEVKLWQATNLKARDFRLEKIGAAYKSSVLTAEKAGTYRGRVAAPAEGFTAYFVELTFASAGKYPFKMTTGVRVTPDRLPFPLPKKEAAAAQTTR